MTRIANGLAVAGLIGLWVGSVLVFGDLPERIPTHFGADGVADAWADRSVFSWFTVPTIAAVLSVIMTVLARWIAAHPERINLPGKERLAQVPERHRGPVVEVIRELFALLHLETVAIMLLVQRATWVGAQGGDTSGLLFGVLALALLSSPALIAFTLIRMQSAVDHALGRARAEGWTAD